MNKLASILIPVFNTEQFIAKAIESVLSQTYTHLEVVIVDDCSTDGTFDICKQYADKDNRIKLYQNKANLGMMANWNYGITLCSGTYWGKLDADDWWEPQFVEKCIDILDGDSEVGLVCSGHTEIDPQGGLMKSYDIPPQFSTQSVEFISLVKQGPSSMLSYPIARQGIGLMRSKLFKDLGPFTLLDGGDTEMWFRIGCHHKVHFIPGLYHHHRIWDENFTRQNVIKKGVQRKNLHDVKISILNYYHDQQKINDAEYGKWTKQTQFEYQAFLAHKQRSENNLLGMVRLMARMFFREPIQFFSFYLNRIIN